MEKPLFVFREEAPKYNYNLLNRLLSVEIYEEGTSSVHKTVFYEYNPKGERVKRTGTDGKTTWYAYDGSGNVIYQEFEGDDRYEEIIYLRGKRFAFNRGKLSAREAGDNTTERYFYITDHLGSVVKITDREGKEVWSNDYKPFGGETGNSGIIEHGAIYTGKDVDPETGLHYFNARWYDSDLGRFVTEDPIKDGNNWYVYCSNNPLIYIDPTGLQATNFEINGEYFDESAVQLSITPITFRSYVPSKGSNVSYTTYKGQAVPIIGNGSGSSYYQPSTPKAPVVSTPPAVSSAAVNVSGMHANVGMISGVSPALGAPVGKIHGPDLKPDAFVFPGLNNDPVEFPGAGTGEPVSMPGAGTGTPVIMPSHNPMGHTGFPLNDAFFPGANNGGGTIGDPQGNQEVLQLGSNKPNQIHHFLTNKSKKYQPQFNKIVEKYGLDLDGEWNKKSLPHQGRHPYAYHEYMLENVLEIDIVAEGDREVFLELFNELKVEVEENPDMLYKDYWRNK